MKTTQYIAFALAFLQVVILCCWIPWLTIVTRAIEPLFAPSILGFTNVALYTLTLALLAVTFIGRNRYSPRRIALANAMVIVSLCLFLLATVVLFEFLPLQPVDVWGGNS